MTTAADPTTVPASPAAPSVRLPFAALVLAMLPAVLDQTILATALPTIATDLGRLSDVSWLVTVYVVAATASTPLWGKLGDRHGRKRLLQVALGAFVAASALCGAAQDLTQLVVVRGVQGLAAGGLMSLAMAAVGDLVSPRERGRYQGYIAATFAGTTVLGPLIGGTLVEHASWRWVFFVNLPIGVAALAALGARLPSPAPGPPAHRLDVAGAGLLAGATCALLLACIWGGDCYAWGSATVVGLVVAAAGLAVAFVARERRAQDPVVPLALLRTPAVGIAAAGLFLLRGVGHRAGQRGVDVPDDVAADRRSRLGGEDRAEDGRADRAPECAEERGDGRGRARTRRRRTARPWPPVVLQAATGATPTEAGLLLVPMMLGISCRRTWRAAGSRGPGA